MAKTEVPHLQKIAIPKTLKPGPLNDTLLVYNGMIEHDLIDLVPEDLLAQSVHDELTAYLASVHNLGTARSTVTQAVETQRDLVKRGERTYSRVIGIIDATYPVGTAGHSAYHPAGSKEHSLGDLIIAAGKGVISRGKPRLPDGLTGEALIKLGEEVNSALAHRVVAGETRKGQANAAATLKKKTLEVRRRLRKIVTEWYGNGNVILLQFGIQPRKPTGGGRKKKVVSVPGNGEMEPT